MARGGDGTSSAPCGLFKGRGGTPRGSPSPLSPGLQSLVRSRHQGGWRVSNLSLAKASPHRSLGRAGPRSASRRSVVRVGSCKDQCVSWSFVLSARMVHRSPQVLLRRSLLPGVTLEQQWRCRGSGTCPGGELSSSVHEEAERGRPRAQGGSGALAVGTLQGWHSWVHALSPFPSDDEQRLPSSSTSQLRQGMAGKAG